MEDVGWAIEREMGTVGTMMTSTYWAFEINLEVLSAWRWIHFRVWRYISSQQHGVSIGGQQRRSAKDG